MVDERAKAIDLAFAQIEKQFGKGSIMRLGSKEAIVPIAVIPTGAISFDAALGVGGFPRGRVVEVFGPESSGKTTITLQVIAEAQKMGGMAAFVDAEHALDPGYAKKLGVDVDNLLVSQPDYGEQALEITEALVRSGAIDVLVVDSVAALVPKAELDGEMGDSHMGLQARLMSQALRKLTGTVSKSRTCLIFINQIRDVRQPRNHNRWPRLEVLLVRPHRYTPHCRHQGGRRRYRFTHQNQGCKEQSGRTLPGS
jgi:recombination protein RecA